MNKDKDEKKTLSRTKINKYVKAGGGYCPYCGSEEYEGGSLDFEGGGIYQNVRCLKCDSDWVDSYTLTNVLE